MEMCCFSFLLSDLSSSLSPPPSYRMAVGKKLEAILRKMFDYVDTDKSGYIEGEEKEFITHTHIHGERERVTHTQIHMYTPFSVRALDSVAEMRAIMKLLAELEDESFDEAAWQEMEQRIMSRDDKDGDGLISFDEVVESFGTSLEGNTHGAFRILPGDREFEALTPLLSPQPVLCVSTF